MKIRKWLIVLGIGVVVAGLALWAVKIGLDGVYGHSSIRFYGQVLDHHGNPVPGAVISAETVRETYHLPVSMYSEWVKKPFQAIADDRGCFCLDGGTGYTLNVLSVSAPGHDSYRWNPRVFDYKTHSFSRHMPDPSRPVPFRLCRMDGSLRVVTGRLQGHLTLERLATAIGLCEQSIRMPGSPGWGDLRVHLCKDDKGGPQGAYDWSVKVIVDDFGVGREVKPGRYVKDPVGLIETEDLSASTAPTSGYEKLKAYEFKAGDKDWTGRLHKKYWMRSRHGLVYAALDLTVDAAGADGKPTCVIVYRFNPTASPELGSIQSR